MNEEGTQFEHPSVTKAYQIVDTLACKGIGDGLRQFVQHPSELSIHDALALLSGEAPPEFLEDLLHKYTDSDLYIPPLLMSLIGKKLGYC